MDSYKKIAALVKGVTLQPHQQELLDFSKGKSGIIANHGLGSGKTLSSLAIAEDKGGDVLVVTPASLQNNYRKEIDKFVEKDRRDKYHIVSYETFRNNPEYYIEKYNPTTLVADEIHRIRNEGLTYNALASIRHRVPNMVGLTASLINNHPTEVVPLVNMVAGDNVFSRNSFRDRYIKEKSVGPGILGRLRGAKSGIVEKIKNRAELQQRLAPYIHRFTGSEEYLSHLPEEVEEEVRVPMSPRQLSIMRELENSRPILGYKVRHNIPPSKRDLTNMNAFMMGMRQASNNPGTYDVTVRDPISESPKLQRIYQDIVDMRKQDRNFRAMIFSNYLGSGIEPLAQGLEGKVPTEIYKGSLTQKQRKKVIDDYLAGKFRVLASSPSGAEGLDLKGVKLMGIMEPNWNPEITAQAIGRSIRYKSHDHLPKSQRKVNVRKYMAVYPDKWYHRFIRKPISIDEYIYNRAKEKDNLNREFYGAVNTYGADKEEVT